MIAALEELPGIQEVRASHPEKKAVVLYNPELVSIEQMQQRLLKLGYVAALKADISHSAGPKKEDIRPFSKDDLVCYCFDYTREDIELDYREKGRSAIMERIILEKKHGACQCETKNPKAR